MSRAVLHLLRGGGRSVSSLLVQQRQFECFPIPPCHSPIVVRSSAEAVLPPSIWGGSFRELMERKVRLPIKAIKGGARVLNPHSSLSVSENNSGSSISRGFGDSRSRTQHATAVQNQMIMYGQPHLLLQKRSVVTILRTVHANGENQGKYNDIEIKVTDFKNSDKGSIVLAGDVFDVPLRPDIVHRVVRWQLAKRRQGTHSTKTISEVSGTGKKPYKQKGTGQARHGTLRGPQFRHGATMHGPKPRDHSHKLQKKVRRLGLKIALSARVVEGKLIVLDSIIPESHKTKEMVKYINGLTDCRKVLFVDGADEVNTNLCRATSNIYLADVIPAKGLNVYSILQHDTLIMTVDAVHFIENRMHTPITHRKALKGKTLKRKIYKRVVKQRHVWYLPSNMCTEECATSEEAAEVMS